MNIEQKYYNREGELIQNCYVNVRLDKLCWTGWQSFENMSEVWQCVNIFIEIYAESDLSGARQQPPATATTNM